MRELPKFKEYTIDERLREFRKVNIQIPSIEFIPFDSDKGREIIKEIRGEHDKV